jgi:transcriptional regulator GlxA family with amidase domain
VAPLVLEELVFRLLRSDAAAVVRRAVVPDGNADAIQRAMVFMRRNAAKPLSVLTVARHVAMSPSHFAHRFRALARVSPMQYLKQLRLNEARALMLSEGLGVGEAAQRVGYESPSHFTRDFKSSFGAAPAVYVRALRGTRRSQPRIAGSGK